MALTPYPSLATLPEVIANGGKIPASYLNPSWISLRHDLGIPSDATITGVGSPSFSDSGYGTLNLPAFGAYPAQTVTQRIQAALDLAATGPLGILWDVRCSVGVQAAAGGSMISALWLRRPGNLHIVGRPGCGAILRAQCNSAILANELPTFGTPVANSGTNTQINAIGNINFGNVTIENLYLNANSGVTTGSPGSPVPGPNQTSPTFGQIYYMNATRWFGVQDLTFRDCTIVGSGGFHMYFGNWQRIRALNCTVDSQGAGGTVGGNDCWHLNGPGNDATFRDMRLACEDDHYACNTADGNNQGGLANVPAWGSVTNVRAFNTTVLRAAPNGNFARVMAAANCVNSGHEFDGVYGTVSSLGLLVNSQAGGAGAGPVGTVDYRNVNIDFTSAGITAGDGATMTGIGRLGLRGVRRSGSHLSLPTVVVGQPLARLVADDFDVQGTGSAGSIARVSSGVTVSLAIIGGASSSSGSLIDNAGTISTLVVSNTDPNTTALTGTAAGTHKGDYYL